MAPLWGGGSRPHRDDVGAAPCALLPRAIRRPRIVRSSRVGGGAWEARFCRLRDVPLPTPWSIPNHRWGAHILPPCRRGLIARNAEPLEPGEARAAEDLDHHCEQ